MSLLPTISDDGRTWNLHRAGVDPIPFAYAELDGTPINLSTSVVTFKIAGGPTVTLVPNPASATGLLIAFSEADLAAIPRIGGDFRIKNETTGQVYLDGKVFIRGIA